MSGFIILHGGGTTAPETTRTLVARAGGPNALILVLAQTSENAETKGKSSADWIKENGGKNVVAPTAPSGDTARMNELIALLQKANGVWIPGGNQNRFMEVFGVSSGVPEAIRGVYLRGGVVGGTSAGAALMSQWMPSGDDAEGKITQDAAKTAPGLGLLPSVIVDTHFFVRERTQRLLNMVMSRGQSGLGVDQDGWAEVDGAGHVTMKAGQAAFFQVASPIRRDKENRLGASDIRLRVLLPGDTLTTGKIR